MFFWQVFLRKAWVRGRGCMRGSSPGVLERTLIYGMGLRERLEEGQDNAWASGSVGTG